MFSAFDHDMMARAIRLARRGRYRARPNPSVGCVLVRDGQLIGEGFTQEFGGDHAEVNALKNCPDAAGAIAYVSLEPCSHQGKTPPCTAALIKAGIAECVVAMTDPNPEVAGSGLAALKAAGIAVRSGLLEAEAERVNAGFFQRMRSDRPRITVKLASSLDGRTAMASGESQWITGASARADVQRLRAGSDAIVTGIGTVIADDPAMTVRDPELDIARQPLRVIVDSRLRTPPEAQILRQEGVTLVVHGLAREEGGAESAADSAIAELNATGAELMAVPVVGEQIDLSALVDHLATRQINDILVECGPRLAGAFVEAGLVDELIVYLAPVLMGSDAQPLLQLPISKMTDKRPLKITDIRKVGDDWRVTCLPES